MTAPNMDFITSIHCYSLKEQGKYFDVFKLKKFESITYSLWNSPTDVKIYVVKIKKTHF